jgi:hypothetical protein
MEAEEILQEKKDGFMIQWEYQITIHELPEPKTEKQKRTIECDQDGLCFVHDVFQGGLQWLQDLFCEKGSEGWELVQSGYHNRELLCIWKKRKEAAEKG